MTHEGVTPSLARRRNRIAVVVGRKGSGKSTLLRSLFVPDHPRVISLDATGESREAYPHALEAFGVIAVYDAIREVHAASDGRAWHVIAVLDDDEQALLFGALAPNYSSRKPSLSVALGGVAVDISEVDLVLPVSGADPRITGAVARGRHHQLSFLCATQRPAQCSRLLSSQADVLVSFAMHEPRDVEWLKRAAGSVFADIVRRALPLHWYALYRAETGVIEVHDETGRITARHDPRRGSQGRQVGLFGIDLADSRPPPSD